MTRQSGEVMKIGATIKKLRKARGLSQEEFSAIVGISAKYLGFIEQNRKVPSIRMLSKITKGLKVKIKNLL